MMDAASKSGGTSGQSGFDLADLRTASATDVGRVRSVNQDAYGEFEDAEQHRQLLFVADGMGGHRGGEVASRLAVEAVGETFGEREDPPERLLDAAFQAANARIFATSMDDMELAGMGTTGVGILLTGEAQGWVAHVGDSRAYRMRGGVLEQLTRDHSVVGELMRRGQLTAEEARVHPQANEILRALGTQDGVEVEIKHVDVAPGDRFMLCSDGLSGMLPEARIAEVLGTADPEAAVLQLVDRANEAGGTDNITVQIALVPDAPFASATDSATHITSPTTENVPGEKAAAEGSMIRWAVTLMLLAAVLWLLISGGDGG
jgi:protein phosphatase